MKHLLLGFLVIGFLLLPTRSWAICTYTSVPGGGSWSAPTTWIQSDTLCSPVPTSNSLIIITSAVTLDQDFTSDDTGSIIITGSGSLIEVGVRTLTIGQSTNAEFPDRMVVNSGGAVSVSLISVQRSSILVDQSASLVNKCNFTIDNLATVTVNGRMEIDGNLELITGNAAINGNGDMLINGCVVGTNGALNQVISGNIEVCVLELPTSCGTGVCNGDIPVNNNANCISVLPVELRALAAHYEPACRCVVLVWQTVSETNNREFIVERSDDGQAFIALGSVAGLGTSQQPHAYEWRDLRARPTPAFYRLRQVDLDGTATLSQIVSVQPAEGARALQIWPTDLTGIYNLQLLAAETTTVTVLTPLSSSVAEANLLANGPTSTLDLRRCPSGLYLIRTTSAYGEQTTRLLHLMP